MQRLRVGTRGSLLALRQCHGLLADLQSAYWLAHREHLSLEVIPIRTAGDRAQSLSAPTGLTKKAWVEDIEQAMMRREIDFAIHSGKDLPHDLQEGTSIMAVGERHFPFDIFVGRKNKDGQRLAFSALAPGMRVGTGSTRRRRFLQTALAGIEVVDHRGNVPTRIEKLDADPRLGGIVLAEAGVRRLGLDVQFERLAPSVMLPSQNQGTLAAQYRSEDVAVQQILALVQHEPTQREFDLERRVADALGGDCGSCLGVFAQHLAGQLILSVKAVSSAAQVVQASAQIELARISANPLSCKGLVDDVLRESREGGIEAVMRS